ncbi:hypothetical protein BD779DRAFT_261681 [Infundibulicybe gibba]|nr:hypothetical protein BD779DRAFT_261681 [Infundibulicybe gibba]
MLRIYNGLGGTVLVTTVDTILAFRVWILYEKSRKLLWFLIALILAEFIAMTTLTIMIVSPISNFFHLGPLLVGCWPATSASPLFLYYSSPTMITSFVMFVMTLYRCLFRNNQMRRTPIFSLFLRDGVFWFLTILLVTTPDTVITVLAREGKPVLLELMIVPTVTIYSLVGSRVLLNIKTLLATNEVLDTTNSVALRTFGDRTTEFRAPLATVIAR